MKPQVCSIDQDVRLTCNESNSCCIPNRGGKLNTVQKEQCTAGNDEEGNTCGVLQQCRQIVDPCSALDDQLNCSKEPGCSFIANPTNGGSCGSYSIVWLVATGTNQSTIYIESLEGMCTTCRLLTYLLCCRQSPFWNMHNSTGPLSEPI